MRYRELSLVVAGYPVSEVFAGLAQRQMGCRAKANLAGITTVHLGERDTSRTCSVCGRLNAKCQLEI
jgi:hypothetical protein